MKKAFTLVELLVVIAVISVLAGLLVPALSDARQIAKQVVCQSNLRQLLMANIGYSTENDGYFVPAASDMLEDNGGLHRWHGVRSSSTEDFNPLKGPLISYLADGKVKECPSKKDFFKSDNWNANFEKGCGGYGYNMTYIGSRLWQGSGYGDPQNFSKTTRATEIRKSADTLMFADTAFLKGQNIIEYSFAEPKYSFNYNGTLSPTVPSIHFRHRQKTDIGWTDGHISCQAMTNLQDQKPLLVVQQIGWLKPLDNSPFDLQ